MDYDLQGVFWGMIFKYGWVDIMWVLMEFVCFGMVNILCCMLEKGLLVIFMMVVGVVFCLCFWLQMYVDMVGVILQVLEVGEVIVYGVVIVVSVGVGVYLSFDDVVCVMVCIWEEIILDLECYV